MDLSFTETFLLYGVNVWNATDQWSFVCNINAYTGSIIYCKGLLLFYIEDWKITWDELTGIGVG